MIVRPVFLHLNWYRYPYQFFDDQLSINSNAHPTERAHLFAKRTVTTIEVEEGRTLAQSMVKHLTGSDTVTARRMREDPWSFTPTHTIFLAANHKPEHLGRLGRGRA